LSLHHGFAFTWQDWQIDFLDAEGAQHHGDATGTVDEEGRMAVIAREDASGGSSCLLRHPDMRRPWETANSAYGALDETAANGD
jgi:hypothetical protein